jgi:hypothetical protein
MRVFCSRSSIGRSVLASRFDNLNGGNQVAEHRKVEDWEKQVEALTAGLHKVTARVEAGNSVPRVMSDN